jgi:hypothetical protein
MTYLFRQLSERGSYPNTSENLGLWHFCRAKRGHFPYDEWLENMNGNGWSYKYDAAYTNFILRIET